MAASETSVISRLPLPISSFIGRESELDKLHQMLASGARLITLVGPGGVGKTRLALEVCAREAIYYPYGAAFVTLEAITDTEHVLPEIARGLSVELSGTAAPLDDLVSALASKRLLLCIDNWEHLVEAAIQIVPLLAACPELQIIATSREALRLRGEQVFAVDPLPLPAPGSPFKPETAAEAQAVQLFVERGRVARPGFELDGRNVAAVAEICSLVDGLPLAIELAAALLRLFSPEALLARMKSSGKFAGRLGSVDILVGGPRDLPARQQTLRSAIDWSYSLLDPDEQRVFRRLAVFAGGCELEAVEAIFSVEGAVYRPLLDSLIDLVDKSLVRVQQLDGEPRFSMLRTIHEYALDQMHAVGDLAQTQEQHALYYNELAKSLGADMRSADPIHGLICLDLEHDNCRASLNWAIEHHQITVAHELCSNLFRFWDIRGLLLEGRRWLDLTLALEGDVPSQLRADVVYAASVLALHQGDFTGSRQRMSECLILRRQSGEVEGIAHALVTLGNIEMGLNFDLTIILSHLSEGMDLFRSIGSRQGEVYSLIKVAWAFFVHRQYDSAKDNTLQALNMNIEINADDPWPYEIGNCWYLLGVIAAAQGDFEQAHDLLEKAKSVLYQIDTSTEKLQLDCDLGKLAIQRNRLEEAEGHLSNVLQGSIDTQDRLNTVDVLDGLMCLAVARSAASVAAQLWGACTAARSALSIPRLEHDQALYEHYITMARTQLGERAFLIAYQRGEAMKLDEAVQFAMEPYAEKGNKPAPKTGRPSYPAGLTAREVEVLRLVAQGLSDNEVAEQLVLSPRTVNAHLTSIYSKLGVNSRVAATRFAVDNGLAG